MEVLGLDIGGANLKAAHTDGTAKTVPFALWKAPQELPSRLNELIKQFSSFDQLAVTMTGELCDCFETKRDGVAAILEGVGEVAANTPVRVWSLEGRFLTLKTASDNPLRVASANWHAQATMFGRLTTNMPALLIDIGSTTTDIIPILEGKPANQAWTDPERLKAHELCYTGVRRTPVCALLQGQHAAEVFATMLDVYLLLGDAPENSNDLDTADHRPANRAYAEDRLARMVCGDRDTVAASQVQALAQEAKWMQAKKIAQCIDEVVWQLSEPPELLVFSGSGAFLENVVLAACTLAHRKVFALEQKVGKDLSNAACAYAVAVLALELAEQIG